MMIGLCFIFTSGFVKLPFKCSLNGYRDTPCTLNIKSEYFQPMNSSFECRSDKYYWSIK